MHIIIKTPRLTIREFLAQEQETYLNHFNDERVTRYLPKRTTPERITIFNNALNQYAVTKTTGTWGIFNKYNDEFIGSCLLRPFNDELTVLELGYSMEYTCWGQGLGTEMALAMVKHAFADKAVTAVVAVTIKANTESQRLLEKAGFAREGTLIRNGEELAFFKLAR